MKFTENDLLDNEHEDNTDVIQEEESIEIPIDKIIDMKFRMMEHIHRYGIPLLQHWDINVWVEFFETF